MQKVLIIRIRQSIYTILKYFFLLNNSKIWIEQFQVVA